MKINAKPTAYTVTSAAFWFYAVITAPSQTRQGCDKLCPNSCPIFHNVLRRFLDSAFCVAHCVARTSNIPYSGGLQK